MTTIADRVQAAYNAGFRNANGVEALNIIVAISMCECGLGTQPCDSGGCNPDCCPESVSCCQWQIYQAAHPGTAAQASTLQGCADLAWSISNQGTSFTPWSTFNDGCFRQFLPTVRSTVASMAPPIGQGTAPSGQSQPTNYSVPDLGSYTSPSPAPTATSADSGGGMSTALGLLLIGGGAALFLTHQHPSGSAPRYAQPASRSGGVFGHG